MFTTFSYLFSHFILIPSKGSLIIVSIFYQYKKQQQNQQIKLKSTIQ